MKKPTNRLEYIQMIAESNNKIKPFKHGEAQEFTNEMVKKRDNDKIVAETIKLFDREDINIGTAKLYGNKTERKWALHLHNKYGDKVKAMVDFIPTYNKGLKTKWGKVIKPSQLVEHLQDVIDAKRKLDRQLQFEIQKEAVAKKEREDAELLKKQRDSYTLEEKERMKKKSEDMFKIIRGF